MLFFMIVSIASCKKEDTTIFNPAKYIIAGNNNFYKLDYNLKNITKSDSIRSSIEYGSFDFVQNPINIDNDSIKDIRYGFSNLYNSGLVIFKGYFICNNYDNEKNIEFAAQEKDYYGGSLDTLNPQKIILINTFSKFDTINENCRWVQDKNVNEIFFISWYSSLKNYFGNYCSQDFNFNINVQDKYIGIRRKVNNKYIYGWLEFSIIDNENLQLKGCALAN